MELWGGHEPTINRVGERYFDQSHYSGHIDRPDDLERFAGLGIKTLRYPALWESVAPDRADLRQWKWVDDRLERIGRLGMRPIVGLIHHGSGPRYTGVLQESFGPGLAAHARAVAERHAWVTDWVPVNEPLTTARFCAQYGVWHPHERGEPQFWLALFNQIDATIAAMRAIREIVPGAKLIQTEDLGRTYATSQMSDQAAFDNERRWMTWDLLCGRVDQGHFFWDRLSRMGFGDRLRKIQAAPCPPDIFGVNHYITSDRFLDHRLDRYPSHAHGGNGRTAYADVEAIRVLMPGPDMMAGALDETWRRYHRPVAITEVHNGCTREEQLRWLHEAWSAARTCQIAGARVEAVTAWSLLGAYHWRNLLSSDDGSYEPGAFDNRSSPPRITAVGRLVRDLASSAVTKSHLAKGEGWWRRDIRIQYQPEHVGSESRAPKRERRHGGGGSPPLLITGATGTLGRAFAAACEWRGLDYVLTARTELAMEDTLSMQECLRRISPWAVINAAGFVRVDDAEQQVDACLHANATGPIALAKACRERDIPVVLF
jgi:dTDP-4-dehydrorhamnose reductase